MEKNHPTTTTSTNTTVDYDALSRWAESEAGEAAIATALSRPENPEEKALADARDAVVRRALANYRNNPNQGR